MSYLPGDKQRLFPPLFPRTDSLSTLPPASSEEELSAARDVLRSVISSSRSTPRITASFPPHHTSIYPSVPPLPVLSVGMTVSTQTDSTTASTVPLEGLVRAAGMSLANFASEIKILEKKLGNQNAEILREIRCFKNN